MTTKVRTLLKISIALVFSTVLFQNCAGETDISAYDNASNSSSGANPVASDTTLPTVTIVSRPIAATVATSATFTLSASDNVSVSRIQCSLDGASFSICPSTVTYSGLLSGNHTFQVQSVDSSNNISAIETYTWNVIQLASVYRSYRASLQDHLYSRSQTEGPSKGWVDEGVAFQVLTQKLSGTTELYRCVVTGTARHFVSTNSACENETADGILGYVFVSQTEAVQKQLYRYFNGVDHIVTAGPVTLNGFRFENNLGWAY